MKFGNSLPLASLFVVCGCMFSVDAFAGNDLTPIVEAQKKIVLQSSKVLKAFEDYGLNAKGEPYQTLWFEEFGVADHLDIFSSAVELYRNTSAMQAKANEMYLHAITKKAAFYCATSQNSFDMAKRSQKLPAGVLDQLDIQSSNIRNACELMEKFQEPSRSKTSK